MYQFDKVYERFDNPDLPVFAIDFDADGRKYKLYRKLHPEELEVFRSSEFSSFLLEDYIYLHSESNIDTIELAIFTLWSDLDNLV